MFRWKLCSCRDVKEQYLGILLDRNVNKDELHNRKEENIRDRRTQSAQTQPEQVDGDVQINLISRYTLHVGNGGLILLLAYVQPNINVEVSEGQWRNIDSAYFFEDCSQRFDRNAKGDAMLLQFDDPYHTVKRMLTHFRAAWFYSTYLLQTRSGYVYFLCLQKAIMGLCRLFCRSCHCLIDNFYSKH